MDNRTEPLPGGVWRIEVAPLTNAYLVARDGSSDAEGLALIDTGTRASGPRLVRSVRMLGLDPLRIDEVLLTHWHPGHAGSAARLAASSAEPRVRAGAEDAAVLSATAPPATGRRSRAGRLVQARLGPPDPVAVVPLDPDAEPLQGVRAVPAPGHTAGHRAYWFPATGLLLAGDAASHVLGCSARPRAWCADLDAAADSLDRLARLDPAIVAFGHGPPLRRSAASRLRRLARRWSAR